MALHFPLQVNGETISTFEAVRISGDVTQAHGSINTYRARILSGDGKTIATTALQHRYGAGVWRLVRDALSILTDGEA